MNTLDLNIKPLQNLNNGNGTFSNWRKDVGYCDNVVDHRLIKSVLLSKSV